MKFQFWQVAFFLCFICSISAQSEWKLVKERSNISVFTRHATNSKYKEVKILGRIKCEMAELVAALEDVDAHVDWVNRTMESKVIDKQSETEFLYYVSTDFPYPARDRDVVIYYKREHQKDTGVVFTTSEAKPESIPEVKGLIRIDVFSSTYKLTPNADGIIEIEYFLKVSPAGRIPAWMVNLGITKGPIETMESLFELVHSGKYADTKVVGLD